MPSTQASTIDDVLGHHASFLDGCLKDCMLTNPELLRVFSKLMSVCVMFTNCMQVPPGLGVRRARGGCGVGGERGMWGGGCGAGRSHNRSPQSVLAMQGLHLLAEVGRG